MRIVRSDVVSHTDAIATTAAAASRAIRHAVYSIDFSPDSLRFCTGGGDGKAKIWLNDLAEIQTCQAEGELLLTTLHYHSKSINTVRFSPSGKLLATCSDDHYVIVCGMRERPVDGSSGEQWYRLVNCHGHSMDVLDVSWSPDETMLASCSIDNNVMVWSVHGRTGVIHPSHVLQAHEGLVKGVAFDPIGRYLCSVASDNTMKIWDTSSWQPAADVTKPFEDVPDVTMFRRLSWAPDGSCICVTAAMEGGKPIAQVLHRKGWSKAVDLVGHDGQLIACRFNPKVFETRDGTPFCAVAVGDRGGVVSVWLSNAERPLVVLKDTCVGFISDCAWSPDGLTLACSANDGSITFVRFTEQELGVPMSETSRQRHFERLYGSNMQQLISRGRTLTETPLALQMRQSSTTSSAAASKSTVVPKVEPQSETPSRPASASGASNASWMSPPPSAIQRPTPIAAAQPRMSAAQLVARQQTTVVRSGKKRIRPVLLSADGSPAAAANGDAADFGPVERMPDASRQSSVTEADTRYTTSGAVSTTIVTTAHGSAADLARKRPRPPAAELGPARERSQVSFACATTLTSDSAIVRMRGYSDVVTHKWTHPSGEGTLYRAEFMKAVASSSLSTTMVRAIHGGNDLWASYIGGRVLVMKGHAEVVALGCEDGTLHLLSAESGLQVFPPIVLGSPVAVIDLCELSAPSNQLLVLAVTVSGELRVYDVTKRKAVIRANVRPLVLSLTWRSSLAASSSGTGVSNAAGRDGGDGGHDAQQRAAVAQGNPCFIEEAWLTDKGLPVLAVSSNAAEGGDVQCFAYDEDLEEFVRIADLRHVLSHYFTLRPGKGGLHDPAQPLEAAQSNIARHSSSRVSEILSAFRARQSEQSLHVEASINHLENKIASAIALHSTQELHQWLERFVWYLATSGGERRLRWLCHSLLTEERRAASDNSEHAQVASTLRLSQTWASQLRESLNLASGREVVETIVLPAILRSQKAQGLVEEIHDMIADEGAASTSASSRLQNGEVRMANTEA